MQPVAASGVDAAANLRRSMIVAAGIGLASIVVLGVLGHPLMGAFACLGLALGAVNTRLLQLSVVKYASSETMSRSRFTSRVLGRLGLITALAFGFGLLVRPDGLGVFAGLAVFQVLMLVGASVPVLRGLRHT